MLHFRILWSIIKRCHIEKFFIVFLVAFFGGALIMRFVEPGINNYGDALWYTFVSCTTIGFGDISAVTHLGRVITVILTIYQMLLLAMFSGVIVSHYLEVIHRVEKHSATVFMDKMEHLTELSPAELAELQERAKKIRVGNLSTSNERK